MNADTADTNSHQQINILFLGGAKRVSMARLFRKAALDRGISASIFSYELSKEVPVASEATIIIGRRWRDPSIMDHLASVVGSLSIDIIVPFVDDAVAVASRFAVEHPDSGVFVPASDPATAEAMFDKISADLIFREAGIPVPDRFESVSPSTHFPVIAKPRHGSASKGIMVFDSFSQWQSTAIDPADYLLQTCISHRREYTVDCYIADDGRQLVVSPRLRVAVAGGEVSDTVTVAIPDLDSASRSVLSALPLRGAVTLQFLCDTDAPTPRFLLMEINPRLGGGAVCSAYAGCDIPGLIIDESLGNQLHEMKPSPGVRMARYMQEVIFTESELIK